MILIKQNESTASLRRVFFFCADDDSADNYAPKTGLTFSNGELKISKAGAVEFNAANYGTVTEVGGGWYSYEYAAGEVDTLGAVMLRTNKTDVYSDAVIAQVVPFNPYDAAGLGLGNLDAAVSTRLPFSSYSAPETMLTYGSGIETGYSLQQALRVILSVLAGRVSGAGTGTEVFRDINNTKNRVTATIDANNNRTNVTTDAS